ncbi:uncharacterized protein OCT59_011044 [Rhizophagus irregularis]|uniref:uncharacterized protein n=1 Tax=Rhizophagus irregularis TaxID=588596 RepID=UPI0033171AF5|nr:hypothetical protein OCT59_011044 [Rhizophagus irregularis]
MMKNIVFSICIIPIPKSSFDLAEQFSINLESRFHLTKVVKLRAEVNKQKKKNSKVSTDMKNVDFSICIIPTPMKINIQVVSTFLNNFQLI